MPSRKQKTTKVIGNYVEKRINKKPFTLDENLLYLVRQQEIELIDAINEELERENEELRLETERHEAILEALEQAIYEREIEMRINIVRSKQLRNRN